MYYVLHCYSCGLYWHQTEYNLICRRCQSDVVEIIDNTYDEIFRQVPIAENQPNQYFPENAVPQEQPNIPYQRDLNDENPVLNTMATNNQSMNWGASTSNQELDRMSSRQRSRRSQDAPSERRSRSRSMTKEEMKRIEKINKSKLKEGEIECGICYESFYGRKSIRRLKCKHTFHQTCIFSWLKKESTCPFCRCNLKDDEDESLSALVENRHI